jgi:hypothetical protein
MLLLIIIFLFIWVSGGLTAFIIMLIRTITHPTWDAYTLSEYIIGFVGSWYTVAVLVEIIKDEDL